MLATHPIVDASVRESLSNRTTKKISYEKLLPYTLKTLKFLVACAQQRRTTTYKKVSEAIRIGSPQNANWGFGAVNRILAALQRDAKFSDIGIPNITTIVMNTGKVTTGRGVFHGTKVANKSEEEKESWLTDERCKALVFDRWDEVLSFLNIEPMENLDVSASELQSFEHESNRQAGKSEEHQAIQDWLEHNLSAVEIQPDTAIVHQEFLFWSLDRLDLLVKTDNEWIGIEVKPSTASENEFRKGLYQVMKYRALLNAELLAKGLPQTARCILVVGGAFPLSLEALRRRFRIRVFQNLRQRIPGAARAVRAKHHLSA